MTQHAPWSQWFKREIIRLYWSFRRQWNLWQMWRLPNHHSDEFKARLRASLNFKRNM